jgi:hypothetical protein
MKDPGLQTSDFDSGLQENSDPPLGAGPDVDRRFQRRRSRHRFKMQLPRIVTSSMMIFGRVRINFRLDEPLWNPTSERPFAHSKLLSGFGRCQPVSDDGEVEASF